MNTNLKAGLIFGASLAAWILAPGVAVTNAFATNLVALPDDALKLILALVTAGVAWLLLKVNMGQYTQLLAAAIAPIIIAAIESALGMIDPVFDNLLLSIIHLLVLFISGSIGTLLLFKRFKQPAQLLA